MQILFTHALNCLGMVVALMSHDNVQSWPWPKRFQRDQQPPPPPIWSTDKHFLDTMWINERFLGVVMWVGSQRHPQSISSREPPKFWWACIQRVRSISTFQEWLFLQVLSLTTYYLQELFPKVASVLSSSSNKLHPRDAINPHFLHHLLTISNNPTTRYFQWGGSDYTHNVSGLHVNFLLKAVMIWKCSCMFLFTSSTKAGNWNNYSAQYCRWASLDLDFFEAGTATTVQHSTAKYTSLDLFSLTPYLPFFSQESRLPLVWNFLHIPQYQDTASRYVAKSIPEKSTGICFLMKNFKSIQYHDQASLLSKVNYQTNTSPYVSYNSVANKKYPIPGARVCSKVATQRPTTLEIFLWKFSKA